MSWHYQPIILLCRNLKEEFEHRPMKEDEVIVNFINNASKTNLHPLGITEKIESSKQCIEQGKYSLEQG